MARQVRQTLPDPPPEYDQQYIAALARSLNSYMSQAQALGEVIAARFISTKPIYIPDSPVPDGPPDTTSLPNTTDLPVGLYYLKKLPALPAVNAVAANPAPTSSTTFVMMGLSILFTAAYTSKGVITMNGQIGNTGNGTTTINLAYGTGPAPANGAPLVGTLLGQPVSYKGPSAGAMSPFAQTALLSGLTVGTTYWVGAAVKVTAASSIATDLEITGQGLRDADEYFLTIVNKQDP